MGTLRKEKGICRRCNVLLTRDDATLSHQNRNLPSAPLFEVTTLRGKKGFPVLIDVSSETAFASPCLETYALAKKLIASSLLSSMGNFVS